MTLPQETKQPKKSSATLILITGEYQQEQSFVKIINSLLLQNTIELEHNIISKYKYNIKEKTKTSPIKSMHFSHQLHKRIRENSDIMRILGYLVNAWVPNPAPDDRLSCKV